MSATGIHSAAVCSQRHCCSELAEIKQCGAERRTSPLQSRISSTRDASQPPAPLCFSAAAAAAARCRADAAERQDRLLLSFGATILRAREV